ncbi:hypothetical protein BC628DRAFT_1380607 [Trametes gibbosa]|nr:hypothetical protein BC628DRAFT_1380607 [Trametes gibbosa]
MDTIAENSELAQDILQLVHAELRQERQERQRLLELQDDLLSETLLVDETVIHNENEKLKEELALLRLRLSVALEDQHVKKEHSNVAEDELEENAEGSHDSEDQLIERAKHESNILSLQSKLAKYQKRSKELKIERNGLQEVLSTLRRDSARQLDHVHHVEHRISVVENELSQCKPEVIRLTECDPTSFLSNVTPNSLPKQGSIRHFLESASFTALPVTIMQRYSVDMLILPKHVLWSEDGVGKVLYPTFLHSYDATAGKGEGAWMSDALAGDIDNKDTSRAREVFCQRQNKWYYYGTYRCVSHCMRGVPGNLETWNQRAYQRLSIQHKSPKDLVAPVVHRFVQSLHATDGPLPLQFLGLERIGFNQGLYNVLLSSRKLLQQTSSQKGAADKSSKKKKQKKGGGKAKKGKRSRNTADGDAGGDQAGRPTKKQRRS